MHALSLRKYSIESLVTDLTLALAVCQLDAERGYDAGIVHIDVTIAALCYVERRIPFHVR